LHYVLGLDTVESASACSPVLYLLWRLVSLIPRLIASHPVSFPDSLPVTQSYSQPHSQTHSLSPSLIPSLIPGLIPRPIPSHPVSFLCLNTAAYGTSGSGVIFTRLCDNHLTFYNFNMVAHTYTIAKKYCIAPPPNTHTHTVWQWQDENSTWQDYDPVLCHKLEVAHTSSSSKAGGEESVSFTIAGRSYTVDVGKMEQVNTETGVRRKVARRAPKGGSPFSLQLHPSFLHFCLPLFHSPLLSG